MASSQFTIQKATRTKMKIKVGLFGPSGSGKTTSALKIAYGLTKDWSKIVVIDTERESASLYSNLGEFNTLVLNPPFHPDRYIQAIKACEEAGMEVIIIDSISHEWMGKGGILQIHEKLTGNSFANWAKVKPLHNEFVDAMLDSNCHIIATSRVKQDYEIQEGSDGKKKVEKMGLKGLTEDGIDYEFTIVFDLDIKHNATSSKDRTQMFADKLINPLDEKIGEQIVEWIASGADVPEPKEDPASKINIDKLFDYAKDQIELEKEFYTTELLSKYKLKDIYELTNTQIKAEIEHIKTVKAEYQASLDDDSFPPKTPESIIEKEKEGEVKAS